MPIGNLTSQILANVYLHEFDFFVRHTLKPLAYMRYGDDFILFVRNKDQALSVQSTGKAFLRNRLNLTLHTRNNVIVKAKQGLHYLGVNIYPNSKALPDKVMKSIDARRTFRNYDSYAAYVRQYGSKKQRVLENLKLDRIKLLIDGDN